MTMKLVVLIALIVCCVSWSSAEDESAKSGGEMDLESVGRQLVEEGRTMVHHAVKRFMIILPAIFFKLGIAFTLLIVITLAAVNNGVIGFLLLVVGLGSVLARLQGSASPVAAVPYISHIPPIHHHQVWDRSDSAVDRSQDTKVYYGSYGGQNGVISPQLSNYYARFGQSTS